MFENSNYLEAIIAYGSLSKAARSLGVTQPALSNYLRQLEKHEGAVFFDRNSIPLKLTKAGEIYYKYLKQNEAVKRDYANEMKDLKKIGNGTVVIGGATSTLACYLSGVTSKFLEKYPDNNVKIMGGLTQNLLTEALNGEMDFFVSANKNNNVELEYLKLLDERIYVCVPTQMVKELFEKAGNDEERRHLTAELVGKRIPMEDFIDGASKNRKYQPVDGTIFQNERFILLEDGTNLREITNIVMDNWRASVSNPIEVSQMLIAFNLCINGAGITFLPESILRYGNFKSYPAIYAVDESVPKRTMYACYKKGRYLSESTLEYLDMLKKALT